MLKLLVLAILVVGLNADTKYLKSLNIDPNAKWGPEDLEDDPTIRPFEIKFESKMIDDLRDRLKHSRDLPPPFENEGFTYGANPIEMKKWINYWANDYNFTAREIYLNQFPQYTIVEAGLKLHFIRIIPENTEGKVVIPVLFMHGWPGSTIEFIPAFKIMMSRFETSDLVFEIIAPSLPGFGFSDRAVRPGMGAVEVGVIMKNLMSKLGHEKFYIQGGDWGSIIGFNMATVFPESVLGYVTNMGLAFTEESLGLIVTATTNPSSLVSAVTADRIYPLGTYLSLLTQESGYFHMFTTKPYTIGAGFNDSPAGLLSWLLQHIATYTNPNAINESDGGLSIYPKDLLLDNVMFYWTESKAISSALIYAEWFNLRNWNEGIFAIPTPVPTYVIQAKRELFYFPPAALKSKYTNLVNCKVMEDGGHFLALELPESFTDLVFEAFEEILAYKKIKNL